MLGWQGSRPPPPSEESTAELRRPAESHKPTRHPDGAAEARRGALAQGSERQADCPSTPLKSEVCRDGSAVPQAKPAPGRGREDRRCRPAPSFTGRQGLCHNAPMGGG